MRTSVNSPLPLGIPEIVLRVRPRRHDRDLRSLLPDRRWRQPSSFRRARDRGRTDRRPARLLPFDIRRHGSSESLEEDRHGWYSSTRTSPGGTTAYMMRQVHRSSRTAITLTRLAAAGRSRRNEHRPAYGSDGDYFSKPNREQIVHGVYELMRESDPRRFPKFDG